MRSSAWGGRLPPLFFGQEEKTADHRSRNDPPRPISMSSRALRLWSWPDSQRIPAKTGDYGRRASSAFEHRLRMSHPRPRPSSPEQLARGHAQGACDPFGAPRSETAGPALEAHNFAHGDPCRRREIGFAEAFLLAQIPNPLSDGEVMVGVVHDQRSAQRSVVGN